MKGKGSPSARVRGVRCAHHRIPPRSIRPWSGAVAPPAASRRVASTDHVRRYVRVPDIPPIPPLPASRFALGSLAVRRASVVRVCTLVLLALAVDFSLLAGSSRGFFFFCGPHPPVLLRRCILRHRVREPDLRLLVVVCVVSRPRQVLSTVERSALLAVDRYLGPRCDRVSLRAERLDPSCFSDVPLDCAQEVQVFELWGDDSDLPSMESRSTPRLLPDASFCSGSIRVCLSGSPALRSPRRRSRIGSVLRTRLQ